MRKRVSRIVPMVQLSDATFATRHRVLQIILWLHLPVLSTVAFLLGRSASPAAGHPGHNLGESATVWTMIAAVAVCSVLSTRVRSPRGGAVVVSTGLILSSAALVHAGGGLTDLHFHFFVMLGLISLYQDWIPFALSVGLVAAHHLIVGMVTPSMLYSDPRAWAHPVPFALMHAAFVLGMCAVQVAYWHFARQAQAETDSVRAEGERTLRRSEERFRVLVQDSCDVITVIDRRGNISAVSPAVEPVTGHHAGDLVGASYRTMIHPDDLPGILEVSPGSGAQKRVEVRVRHADGSWQWHDVTLRDLCDHPAIEGIVAHHRDISDRRAFQERLAHEAAHDALTGLANRPSFLRTTRAAVASATRENRLAAVLFLDLDGFKQVNDTLGHEAGDAILVAVAEKLRRCVLGSDVVGRLGGDEFAVTLTGINSPDNAVMVARRILTELGTPCTIMDREVRAGGSVGIAVSGPDADDIDELLRRADTAMYRAKRDKTTGWQLYVEGIHGDPAESLALEDDLGEAVERGQMRVLYQPLVTMEEGRLIGVEALVRWEHPTRGLLPPASFIPLAEEVEIIGQIGQWVLETACTQVGRWRAGMPHGRRLSLSINVSAREVQRESWIRDVAEVLERTGFDPHDLIVELSETALVEDDDAIARLRWLNARGVRIALDDFGTGRWSLEQLSLLPVDVLKLNQRFVASLDGTPRGSAVAVAAIRLGTMLNLDVVAKGVESAAQADELALLGCPTAQGFHYSAPLDVPALDAWVDAWVDAPEPQRSGGTLSGAP
jgi:diguanylate cyclase (GGDEF)-like protein/PAS domain S-box-containing protein